MKKTQKGALQKESKVHMGEMIQVLKSAYLRKFFYLSSFDRLIIYVLIHDIGGFSTFGTGVDGIEALAFNQNVVISPGLKVDLHSSFICIFIYLLFFLIPLLLIDWNEFIY